MWAGGRPGQVTQPLTPSLEGFILGPKCLPKGDMLIQEGKGPHVTVYRPDVECDELSFLKWMSAPRRVCLALSSSPVSSPSRPPGLPLTFTQHLAKPRKTAGAALQPAACSAVAGCGHGGHAHAWVPV